MEMIRLLMGEVMWMKREMHMRNTSSFQYILREKKIAIV